jgi:hypothetical protein
VINKGWDGHVARTGEMINALVHKTAVIKLNEEYWGELGVDGKIILTWILKKQEVRV